MTVKRKRKPNGAELLLMGANPHGRGKLNNPLLNAHFTADQKLELGRLGIKWTSIQNERDARRAKKALADAAKIRSRFHNPSLSSANPMLIAEQREKAQEIYTGFHATPAKKRIVLDEPHIPAGTYPELGLLMLIGFKPTNKSAREHYEKNYVCERENVHVIGSLDRNQLHFAGGDQRIDHQTLRYFGWDGSQQNFELGEARKIVYLAHKYHDAVQKNARGELVEWVHPFGEESGELPRLFYDTAVDRIYLKHGEYRIQDEGIVN